jgi:formylglycine-generating enzyme required for sulfatase activity
LEVHVNEIIRRSLFVLAMLAILAPRAEAQSTEPSGILRFSDRELSPLALRLPKPLSRNEEAALEPMDRFRECEQCPEMVAIPRGKFTMGASASEPGSTSDERPQHQVTVQGFGVGQFPVTNNEWMACVLARGCSYRPDSVATENGRQAVGNILWEEAKEYVQFLARKTGRPYRLLSEAEREYVTRAGTTTAFWWGDSTDPAEASNFRSVEMSSAQATASLAATPFGANPWGLYEVHGSTYDWVEDCWHPNYQGAPADGSAWITDDCSGHVLRGGATSRSAQTRRSAARIWFGSPNRLLYMGVRVARNLAQ